MALRFQAGCGCCGPEEPCGEVCFGVIDCFIIPVDGATITLKKGGATVGTCTTVETDKVTTIHVDNGGTGYSTAPTVTISGGGGTGATATADIFGLSGSARVSAIHIVSRGSGYTSAPTVSFSGGGGSGTTATAFLGGACCIPITVAGTDYSYTIAKSGYTTKTSSTFSATCATTNVGEVLSTTQGRVCVTAKACFGGLTAPDEGDAVPGATVTLSQSGVTKATGTTASNGQVCFILPVGTYDVDVTADRFVFSSSYGNTVRSQACITNTLIMLGEGAPGYHCFGSQNQIGFPGICRIPVSDTLTLTDSLFGTTTLNYNASGAQGAGWYGSTPITFPNCLNPSCSGAADMIYFLSANAHLTAVTPPSGDCTSGIGTFADRTPSDFISCPPSFLATWATSDPTGVCGGDVTITVTE